MAEKKKTILVITGTRAEYGLLKPVMKEIQKSQKLALRVLVTGMHTQKKYGLTINEIKQDKMPIDCVVAVDENDDMLEAFSREIVGMKNYLQNNRPDLVLVLGDRLEMLAAAIAASFFKIPIGHLHGGDMAGENIDEYVRACLTQFAQLHFPATLQSAKRVLALGANKKNVFMVGAPGIDAIKQEQILNKKELSGLLGLDVKKKWLLFLEHPTVLDKTPMKEQIKGALSVLKEKELKDFEKVIIYPNSDEGSDVFISEIEKLRKTSGFYIFKNLNHNVFLSLMKNADLMMGNSSSAIIESTIFKTPVIDIGNRQTNRERGQNIISCGYDKATIMKALKKALTPAFQKVCLASKSPYGTGNAAKKIVSILEKTDFKKL